MGKGMLANNIEILKMIGYDTSNIVKPLEIEETNEGLHTYKYPIDENKEIYIHSKYNIGREVNSIFQDINFNKDSIFIVYGLGLGYHIKELRKKISSRSFIFVIEKNWDIISTYLNYEDLSEIVGSNVLFLLGDEDKILTKFSTNIFAFNTMSLLGNLNYIILPSYYKIYGKWIHDINDKIMDIIKHAFFNLGNDVEDTIIGIENNFENMEELIKSPSIETIKNIYKDIPGIIVGAGPSLDKNIEELKKAEGKAIIIATDAVLSTLKNYNIIPDGVVSIERGILTYEKFYKDKDIDDRIVYIGPPVVRKEILEQMKRNKKLIVLKQGEKINEWINNDILNENRLLTMGTSCAHVAFAFLQYVGANPIVFIGQDLAYTREGITHSKDVEVKNKVDPEETKVCYVKGINGEDLPTSEAYKNFLTWYEIQIAKDYSDREYIDATEGGALINGTILMDLKEVIKRYCEKDISRLYSVLPKWKFDIDKYKKAIEETEVLFNKFDEIRKEAGAQVLRLDKLEKKTIKYKTKLRNSDMEKALTELNKAVKVEQLILNNGVTRLFFQGIVMTSTIRIRMLGNEIDTDVIKSNIDIQKRMLVYILWGCYAVQESLIKVNNKMRENLKKLIYNIEDSLEEI